MTFANGNRLVAEVNFRFLINITPIFKADHKTEHTCKTFSAMPENNNNNNTPWALTEQAFKETALKLYRNVSGVYSLSLCTNTF